MSRRAWLLSPWLLVNCHTSSFEDLANVCLVPEGVEEVDPGSAIPFIQLSYEANQPMLLRATFQHNVDSRVLDAECSVERIDGVVDIQTHFEIRIKRFGADDGLSIAHTDCPVEALPPGDHLLRYGDLTLALTLPSLSSPICFFPSG